MNNFNTVDPLVVDVREDDATTLSDKCMLIGKKVVFSITKDTTEEGIVLDKINKKEKVEDEFTVTGYMIRQKDGKVKPISHWRILEIVDLSKPELEQVPTKYIKGGYNPQQARM